MPQPGHDADDIVRTSATVLAGEIRARKLCPVALMEATLRRIAAVNPAVNAMCTLADDAQDKAQAARAQLDRGEPVGPLHGLPVGIKDVTPTAGLRTTYASPLYADHVPTEDALVVSRLRAAGAIIVGKTNTPEMAVGVHTDNALFGPTRNPWALDRSVGGSTGGGAAALACGMVALADGTDVGGSLRVPPAYCGVVGLRPSPGLVPKRPAVDPWDDLEALGPMARTVADVALMLQVIAGHSPGVPSARAAAGRDFVAAAGRPITPGLRVGWCPDISARGIEPALAALARQTAYQLEAEGARVDDVGLDLAPGHDAFAVLRGQWMVTQHLDLLDRMDQLGPNLAGNLRLGLELTPSQIGAAKRARAELLRRMQALFARVEVLITPTVAVPPFRIADGPPMTIGGQPMKTYIDWVAPTYLLTLTSSPVLAVPCGQDGNGLPVGIQIVAPVDREELVLQVGAAVERAVSTARFSTGQPRFPPLDAIMRPVSRNAPLAPGET